MPYHSSTIKNTITPNMYSQIIIITSPFLKPLCMQLSMLGPTPSTQVQERWGFDLPCNQLPYPGVKLTIKSYPYLVFMYVEGLLHVSHHHMMSHTSRNGAPWKLGYILCGIHAEIAIIGQLQWSHIQYLLSCFS